jgi:hypothetical protein
LFPEKKPEVFRNDCTIKISNWFQICFLWKSLEVFRNNLNFKIPYEKE